MDADIMGRVILFILKSIAWVYGIIPRKAQLFLGNCLGGILFRVRLRYPVVRQNLSIVFPGRDTAFYQQMARASYQHLGNLVLEILMLLGPLRKFVSKYVEVEGFENFTEARRQGKGVIFLSSHVGNWEVMAATGGFLKNTDLMLVTKHLKPEWLHQAIEAGRARCDVRATYEPRTLRDVLSHLKKQGTVGFVIDQYVGPPVGVRVPLFGKAVGTALVVAAVAKRTGAAVLPVENYRRADGRWVVSVQPGLPWIEHSDPHYELAANTAQFTAAVEKHILRHPEQWLWTHKRFKGDLSPLREREWFEARVRR